MEKENRHNEAHSIRDLMKIVIEKNHLTQGLRQVEVGEVWEKEMGKGIANYTNKITLKGDLLIVYLNSSVVREELSYGKEKIIKILNEALGEELIKNIRFT